MKTAMINLSDTEKIPRFTEIVSRFPFDVELRSGRHIVNAKSLLGIFSLDLRKNVEALIWSEECDELLSALDKFVVA